MHPLLPLQSVTMETSLSPITRRHGDVMRAGGRVLTDGVTNDNAESRILELRADDSQHRSVRCSVVARRNGTFVRSVSCDELVLSYEEWVSMASGKCLTL